MSIQNISEKFRTVLVGGAVRDMIMGIEPKDKDYLVEASQEEFEKAFPYSIFQRVGNSFPVYIIDGHEVALARTEKVVGEKYQDFEVTTGVSIEEDLGRRDFTINSIAYDEKTGEFIDPFHGIADIKLGTMRAINKDAFSDDPLRIIRGFRFMVRYGFSITVDTMKNMRDNVHRLADITPERIELEIRKMYEQTIERPSNFFRLIDQIGGLKYIGFDQFEKAKEVLAGKPEHHPEGSTFNHLMNALDYAKENNFPYHVAIASMLHDLGKIESPEPPSHIGHDLKIEVLDEFFSKHRFSSDVMELSKVVFRRHMDVHNLEKIKKPVKLVRFFKRIPKHRRDDFFKAVNADSVLNDKQNEIINRLHKTFEITTIDIPKAVQERGKEIVVQFVEAKYAEKYNELLKETYVSQDI